MATENTLVQRIQAALTESKGPRYRRIAAAICGAIESGELEVGDKLPTHRWLADAVGVSVQTVSFAYAYAEQEGFVHGRVGSGTYVSSRSNEQQVAFLQNAEPKASQTASVIDLSIVCAPGDEAQQRAFQQSLSRMSQEPQSLQLINTIKPFAGLDRHRQAASEWLNHCRMPVPSDQLCICNGVTHGLLIAISSAVRPGEAVACEALVDHGLIALARTLNLKLEGIPMDEQGMLPEELELCCRTKKPAAICVTPTLHNPTTATQSDQRRQQIAEIAARYQIPVIEDDVFGRLPENSLAPISSYIPEQSYYLTSLTKSVASGLRVGFLVPPVSAFSQVVGRLRASSWMATPFVAELASQWIGDGTAEQLLKANRQLLQHRQKQAAELLEGVKYQHNEAGPLIWLQLPEHWRADAFITQARERNVSITPIEPFVVGHQSAPHAVRISLSSIQNEQQLHQGLSALKTLLQQEPEPSSQAGEIY